MHPTTFPSSPYFRESSSISAQPRAATAHFTMPLKSRPPPLGDFALPMAQEIHAQADIDAMTPSHGRHLPLRPEITPGRAAALMGMRRAGEVVREARPADDARDEASTFHRSHGRRRCAGARPPTCLRLARRFLVRSEFPPCFARDTSTFLSAFSAPGDCFAAAMAPRRLLPSC